MTVLREPRPAVPAPEVPRDLAARLPHATAQAVVLTGPRRCGKSTLLDQWLRRTPGSVLLNFEDTRLFGLTPSDYPMLLEIIGALPTTAAIGLDEVQEAPQWQRLVRALLDRHRRVALTGSNAGLLGKDLGTKLTGRHLSFELLPFGYGEYLKWCGQAPGESSLLGWLDRGGYPGYLREGNDAGLRELLRDVVHRDITARHALRETRHVLNLALYLLANTGQPVSLQRLTKSLGIPGVGQTAEYASYIQDAYLLFGLPKFSPSFRSRLASPLKYYAVDNGLRRANAPQPSPDLGRRLENAVYLALRARGVDVGWAGDRDVWECDFVTPDEAIQVCAQVTTENLPRALNGLRHAVALPGRRRRALLLTLGRTDRLHDDGLDVEVLPAWRWLVEATTAGRSRSRR